MAKVFRSVTFDKENKTFTILDGTTGTYPFSSIVKCSILNEDAKYRGKTKPFFHQVLGGTAFFSMLGEPSLYVGLCIKTKEDETLAIYTSEKPVYFNADMYKKDKEEAEKIDKVFQSIIKSNRNFL